LELALEARDKAEALATAKRRGIFVADIRMDQSNTSAPPPIPDRTRAITSMSSRLPNRNVLPASARRQSIWTRKIDEKSFQQLGAAVGGVIGLLICIAVFIWACSWNTGSNGSGRDIAPIAALPTFHVVDALTNEPDTSVNFSSWKIEGYTLGGTMIWEGSERISELTYTIKRGGAVVDRGSIYVPGDGMRAQEATEVHITVMQEITSDMDVTIEVGH
jgi:hypothetical protein